MNKKYIIIKEDNLKQNITSELNRFKICHGMPIKATITTTTKCNLNCNMCKYHGQEKISCETFPFNKFKEVSEELFPYLLEFHPTVKGEPLLTPYFNEIIEIINKYNVKLNLTTNGMLLNENISRLILPFLRDVKISFDGGNKRTFENIRDGANFEQIIENINSFVKIKNNYVNSISPSYIPTITMQSVLMKSNIDELCEIVNLANKLKVDRVKGFNLMVMNKEFINESLLFSQKMANQKLISAITLAKSFGLQTKYQDLFDLKFDIFNYDDNFDRKRNCDFLWQQINIESNGDVKPCCHPLAPKMGNVYFNSIREIWNNEKYQEMREKIDSSNAFYCCKNCAMLSMKVLSAKAFIFINI